MKRISVVMMFIFAGVGSLKAQDGRATSNVFPQYANGTFPDGSYYQTSLYVQNPTSYPANCTSRLRIDNEC